MGRSSLNPRKKLKKKKPRLVLNPKLRKLRGVEVDLEADLERKREKEAAPILKAAMRGRRRKVRNIRRIRIGRRMRKRRRKRSIIREVVLEGKGVLRN